MKVAERSRLFVGSKAALVVEDLVQALGHVSGGLDLPALRDVGRCNSDEGKAKAGRGVHVAVSSVAQACQERVFDQ